MSLSYFNRLTVVRLRADNGSSVYAEIIKVTKKKKRTFINSLYVVAAFFMLDVTSSYLADIAEERISVLLKGLRNVLNAKFC